MTAAQTIESLIKIAMVVKEASDAAPEHDLRSFLGGEGFREIEGLVQMLVDSLDDEDIDAAIERLAAKQAALRGPGSLADLPTDKLIQHLQLGDARLALSARRVQVSMEPDFLAWAVDEVLPTLGKVAAAVLPLVL